MNAKEKNKLKMSKWRSANPTRSKASYKRQDYKRNFGLSEKDVLELLEKQHGCCAICGEAERALGNSGKIRRLSIDHCHATGKIRGILCYRCNFVLGLCRDKAELFRSFAMYVEHADTGLKIPSNSPYVSSGTKKTHVIKDKLETLDLF